MNRGPDHGSVAEETARLLEALQDAAARWTGGAAGDGEDGDGHTPSTCRVCPLCRAVAAVQNVRPETVQHLAEAAVSMAVAVSEVVGAATEERRPDGEPAGTPAPGDAPDQPVPDGAHGPARPDVQHIDISD